MNAGTMDIAIIGYGTAGQALALLLSADGHRVQVFERASQLGPVGAGFLLQPTGLQVLWQLGLLSRAQAHGRPVHRLFGETPCGRAVMDMRYADLDGRLSGLGMQRGALFTLMDRAWQSGRNIRLGTEITRIDHRQRTVQDADGQVHGPYDLIIVADGSASQLRGQAGTAALDRPYPWGALWCLVPQRDWPWPHELRQRYVAARKMIGLLPVGTRPGDEVPMLSFFWSLPADAHAAWREQGVEAWRVEVGRLWPQAQACLAGIELPEQLARASYRDTVMRQWHDGPVVLAGDAAHAMSPQLGQGVNMALMDALALRDCLRRERGLPVALAEYQRQRQAHVAIYHFWSRWLTPLFQSEQDGWARMRDVAFRPMGRLPLGRGHMLRVLSGTQHGWWKSLALDAGFLDALQDNAGAEGGESASAT